MAIRESVITVIVCDECKFKRRFGEKKDKAEGTAQWLGWKMRIPTGNGKRKDLCRMCWNDSEITDG